MPRTIKFEGRTLTVPDDATDAEIQQILVPAAPAEPRMERIGLHHYPVLSDAEARAATQQRVESLPAIGATAGGFAGGPWGSFAGAGLGNVIKGLLRSQWPAVFGQDTQEPVGDFAKDVTLNAALPEAFGAGLSAAYRNPLAALPILRSTPAVREGVARMVTQNIQNQFGAPEEQLLSQGAKEAAVRRRMQQYQIGNTGKFIQSPLDESLGPLATSPRTGQLEPIPNQYDSSAYPGVNLDPEATRAYQEERFGPSAPMQPIKIVPQTASAQPIKFIKNTPVEELPIPKPLPEDFPLPPKPIEQKSTPGLNAQAKREYQAALDKREADYKRALTEWQVKTNDLNNFTKEVNKQTSVQASPTEQVMIPGSYQIRVTGPVQETAKPANQFEKNLFEVRNLLDQGKDVVQSDAWRNLRKTALENPETVRRMQLIAGPRAVEDMAFNELLGNPDKVLNVKDVLARLADPKQVATWERAISPESRATFGEMLSQIQSQMEGHGVSDTLLKVSKSKLTYLPTFGLIHYPGVAVPVVGGALSVNMTNRALAKLMSNPEYAQVVTRALTTSSKSVEAPMIGEVLATVLRTLNQPSNSQQQ